MPDAREVRAADPHERADPPERCRVPTRVDETTEGVRQAQAALAEITARQAAEAARQAEEESYLAKIGRRPDQSSVAAADSGTDAVLTRQQ